MKHFLISVNVIKVFHTTITTNNDDDDDSNNNNDKKEFPFLTTFHNTLLPRHCPGFNIAKPVVGNP